MGPFLLFDGPCDESSARLVRREVRRLQAALEVGSRVVEDLELAATELVTNAVRSGASRIDVRLEVLPPRLELRVTDDGPGTPVLGAHDTTGEAGRGLQIVASVASAWGWTPAGVSKTVWVRFVG